MAAPGVCVGSCDGGWASQHELSDLPTISPHGHVLMLSVH